MILYFTKSLSNPKLNTDIVILSANKSAATVIVNNCEYNLIRNALIRALYGNYRTKVIPLPIFLISQ